MIRKGEENFLVRFNLQSLWDLLPVEIQEHILHLASKQDRLEKSQEKHDLCREIRTYHKMKRMWRIGHLGCVFVKCSSPYCSKKSYQLFNFVQDDNCHFHFRISGYCTLLNGDVHRFYLGWGLELCRCSNSLYETMYSK